MTPDYVTAWGTTLAEDIAMLETPQPGTWSWDSSFDELELESADMQFPATATFVHGPESIRLREHIAGGVGTVCDDGLVLIDGTLTFTNEQGDVIVSIPITADRMDMATPRYTAMAILIPYTDFSSTDLTPLESFQEMGVAALINWFTDQGLHGEFTYFTRTMDTPTTGHGVSRRIALFEPTPS